MSSFPRNLVVRLGFLEAMHLTRLSVSRIKEVIDSCLGQFGEDEFSSSMSRTIAETVKLQVKECIAERFKVIAEAFVYEDRGQAIRIVSKCLWDKDRDVMVQSEKVCDNGTTIVVIVYCIYFE